MRYRIGGTNNHAENFFLALKMYHSSNGKFSKKPCVCRGVVRSAVIDKDNITSTHDSNRNERRFLGQKVNRKYRI